MAHFSYGSVNHDVYLPLKMKCSQLYTKTHMISLEFDQPKYKYILLEVLNIGVYTLIYCIINFLTKHFMATTYEIWLGVVKVSYTRSDINIMIVRFVLGDFLLVCKICVKYHTYIFNRAQIISSLDCFGK